MFLFKFFHKCNQCLHTLQRHGIVDRCTHSANCTVPLQIAHTGAESFSQGTSVAASAFQVARKVTFIKERSSLRTVVV